jgi:uncharacterized membrane protein
VISLMSPTTSLQSNKLSTKILQYKPRILSMSSHNDRLPLSILSSIGAVEMSYLTYNKIMNIPTFCMSQSETCNSILTGPFSIVPFSNIPLTLIGFVTYSAVLLLSTLDNVPFLNNDKKDVAVLMLSTSMATFSLYLMVILQFVLQASCPYCYMSAILSMSMAIFAWSKRIVPNKTTAFVASTSSCAVTALASGLMFYFTTSFFSPDIAIASTAPAAQYLAAEAEKDTPKAPPVITKASSKKAVELATRIEKLGGKMYGAYWCSHCNNQKQEFGKEAFEKIEYLECDKKGVNSKSGICKVKKIPGYPTWELAGKYFPGEKSLEELEDLVTEVEKSL